MITAGKEYLVLPALSTSGREGMAGPVAVRPLADATADRIVVLAWRRTDPRSPEFPKSATMLRSRLPQGVALP